MSNWTEGYVTEIAYTHGYYDHLAPTMQRFIILLRGYAPPSEAGAYLELGYGQGLSAAIHAAATPHPIWGTDFNPAQASHAQSLIRAAGIEAHFLDDSFAELAARPDLPKFDYIAAHGIWSWISNESRAQITEILRDYLTVGGIAYLSYNTLPGWSTALPLRHLLTLHAETAGGGLHGMEGRIDGALAFARKLVDSNAAYFDAHPEIVKRLEKMQAMDRHYLAHEYFNRHWDPMPFSDMVEWLSPAKLGFIGSARPLDQINSISLSSEALAVLNEISHPVLKESVRDYFVNQPFRADLFMRGGRKLSRLEQHEALLATSFVLRTRIEDVPLKASAPRGEVTLTPAIYTPVLEAFAKNKYEPRTLRQVNQELPNITHDQLVEAVTVLAGIGHLFPAQSADVISLVTGKTKALNRELCRRARAADDIGHLASPVTGAGVPVGRFFQIFLLAMADGHKAPEEWARYTWRILAAQGQSLLKDGQVLSGAKDNIAHLTVMAKDFAEKRLPVLRALGIAD